MANDSSTGGYLAPTSKGGELNDQALADFLQQVVVGVVGLSGSLVRPRWQVEPPNTPAFDVDWVALGAVDREQDVFAYVAQQNEQAVVYRQQILKVLCSFYGPNCESNGETLSMGFQIPQNLEVMKTNGFGFIECGGIIVVPEQIHDRWLRRCDITFRVRRVQLYTYPVHSLLGAQGTVVDDNGKLNKAINVNHLTVLNGPVFGWGLSTEFFGGWGVGSWN